MNNPLEEFWDQILSRDPVQIKQAYDLLDPETRSAVLTHLQNMTIADGWQIEQRASASAALSALGQKRPFARRKRRSLKESHGHS